MRHLLRMNTSKMSLTIHVCGVLESPGRRRKDASLCRPEVDQSHRIASLLVLDSCVVFMVYTNK